MIASAAASLLIPLALTAGLDASSPSASFHHEVRAHVTGYNTVAGQTDSTPCIAASGANICGRRDVVACPRHIRLGTVVEIRGTTYVCEDRLAKKFDGRFDISCDKDKACPYEVAGWTDIKVFDVGQPQPAVSTKASDAPAPQRATAPVRVAGSTPPQRPYAPARVLAAMHPGLASAAAKVFPGARPQPVIAQARALEPARPQLAVATANFIARTTTNRVAMLAKPVSVLRGHI